VVFGWQEAYVGDHGYSPFGAPTSVPLSLSHGEIVQVEVKRAAQKEGSTLGAPIQEKTTEVPVPVEAVGAKVTPRVDGGRANEAEPRPEDTPGGAAFIPGSPVGLGFCPPRGITSDNVMSAPGSFDVVDLGGGELGLPGYPRVPLLPTSWRQVAGRGCGVDMFAGGDRVPIAEGDIGHSQSGCSTTGAGQS
jgi:hypothetical protein